MMNSRSSDFLFGLASYAVRLVRFFVGESKMGKPRIARMSDVCHQDLTPYWLLFTAFSTLKQAYGKLIRAMSPPSTLPNQCTKTHLPCPPSAIDLPRMVENKYLFGPIGGTGPQDRGRRVGYQLPLAGMIAEGMEAQLDGPYVPHDHRRHLAKQPHGKKRILLVPVAFLTAKKRLIPAKRNPALRGRDVDIADHLLLDGQDPVVHLRPLRHVEHAN